MIRSAHHSAADNLAVATGRVDWARPWLAHLAERGAAWRMAADAGFDALLDAMQRDARRSGLATGNGRPLGFVPQRMLPAGAAYESHIAQTGDVPTRANLHDFFNALTWFAFGSLKAALNARQAGAIDSGGVSGVRGRLRDRLTLFDENGALFACADLSVARALQALDWRALFVEQRGAWGGRCEAVPFGHALLEKLVTPYKAITAHAWIVDVPPEYFDWPSARRIAYLDTRVGAWIREGDLESMPLQPLPVLGVPGWWVANEDPAFYDDDTVFRRATLRTAKRIRRSPPSQEGGGKSGLQKAG